MSKGTCRVFFLFVCFLIIIAVEAGAILISYKIVPRYQAFVIVNVKDFICKIYALFKHEGHVEEAIYNSIFHLTVTFCM